LLEEFERIVAKRGTKDKAFVNNQEWSQIMDVGIPELDGKMMQWSKLQSALAPAENYKDKDYGFMNAKIDFMKFIDRYEPDNDAFKTAMKTGEATEEKIRNPLRGMYRHHKTLVEVFRFLDTSGDGILEASEWRDGIAALKAVMQPSELQEIAGVEDLFQAFDFDGSGKVNINEFLEGARLSAAAKHMHHQASEQVLVPRVSSDGHNRSDSLVLRCQGWDGKAAGQVNEMARSRYATAPAGSPSRGALAQSMDSRLSALKSTDQGTASADLKTASFTS